MASEYTVELGKRIRAARIKAGLTQSELAERADVSTNHISAIERGVYDTRVEMLYRIATVLGVSGDYLLMGAALQPNTQARQSLSSGRARGRYREDGTIYPAWGRIDRIIKQPKTMRAADGLHSFCFFCGLHNQFVV